MKYLDLYWNQNWSFATDQLQWVAEKHPDTV